VQIKSVSYDENIVLRKLLADYCKVSPDSPYSVELLLELTFLFSGAVCSTC
jgi:hypothetical protein